MKRKDAISGMKQRCRYCGKVLNNGQEKYCNEDCRMKTHAFQHYADRTIYILLFLFLLGTIGVIIGSIITMMRPGIGSGIIGLSLILWGISFFILPFGVPESFHWFGILNSVRFTRIVSLLVILAGIIMAITGFAG